jgi:non-canonical purine NTP pyrophosphatase (RdgB/HAM1 family)
VKDLTFITGNENKAYYLAKWLDQPIKHHKLDLDEIQSLDLHKIVEHKVRQAYEILKIPVLVEDVSLEFTAIKRLPGPFIKWFLEELGPDGLAAFAHQLKDQKAIATVCYGLYDGREIHYFEGVMHGRIASKPKGEGGFGFDRIFIHDGFTITRAEMSEEDFTAHSSRRQAIEKLQAFLANTAQGD